MYVYLILCVFPFSHGETPTRDQAQLFFNICERFWGTNPSHLIGKHSWVFLDSKQAHFNVVVDVSIGAL